MEFRLIRYIVQYAFVDDDSNDFLRNLVPTSCSFRVSSVSSIMHQLPDPSPRPRYLHPRRPPHA
jgi:hypothetical protein